MPRVYAPQPGPQTDFLRCTADVALYGGAAGSGKTHALLLEAVRHHGVPGFAGVVFRRTTPQIANPGGLWDKARPVLRDFGARLREKPTFDARFPSGATMQFSHLEKESNAHDWQGAELAFIGFEEATHFTSTQVLYLLSRNRTTCGVRPYSRLTSNPDPRSFLLEWVRPYLDDEGYPHPDKAGALRYFAQDGDAPIWGDSREEVLEQATTDLLEDGRLRPEDVVLSFAFIPAKLDDNPALLEADPAYRARLNALGLVQRERLLKGNWLAIESAGNMFRREWLPIVDDYPRDAFGVRYWDLAGGKRRRSDFTSGAKMVTKNGQFWILDVQNRRGSPHETEQLLRSTAELDGRGLEVWIEQETGAAAQIAIDHYQRHVLVGWSVQGQAVRGEGTKIERATPLSSAAQAGNVFLVRGDWNAEFVAQAEAFPDGLHDDMIDAASGAHLKCSTGGLAFGSTS